MRLFIENDWSTKIFPGNECAPGSLQNPIQQVYVGRFSGRGYCWSHLCIWWCYTDFQNWIRSWVWLGTTGALETPGLAFHEWSSGTNPDCVERLLTALSAARTGHERLEEQLPERFVWLWLIAWIAWTRGLANGTTFAWRYMITNSKTQGADGLSLFQDGCTGTKII